MPVFNIAQQQPIDLTPIQPLVYDSVATGSEGLSEADGDAISLAYDPSLHFAGDVVNDGEATFYILPIGTGDLAPTKAQVLASGVPVLPGGSSYQIPERSQLLFYVACQTGETVVRYQFFG